MSWWFRVRGRCRGTCVVLVFCGICVCAWNERRWYGLVGVVRQRLSCGVLLRWRCPPCPVPCGVLLARQRVVCVGCLVSAVRCGPVWFHGPRRIGERRVYVQRAVCAGLLLCCRVHELDAAHVPGRLFLSIGGCRCAARLLAGLRVRCRFHCRDPGPLRWLRRGGDVCAWAVGRVMRRALCGRVHLRGKRGACRVHGVPCRPYVRRWSRHRGVYHGMPCWILLPGCERDGRVWRGHV